MGERMTKSSDKEPIPSNNACQDYRMDRFEKMSRQEAEWLIQEEQRQKAKPVLHEDYDSDMEEVLSQIRNLQKRVNALEKKQDGQE